MKALKLLFVSAFLLLSLGDAMAEDPSAPIWGLYASGVGEALRPGMDPCWITYTVGLVTDPRIQNNVAMGLMGPIMVNVTWWDASAGLRRFGRYFDNQPDGIFKLTPCISGTNNQNDHSNTTGGGGGGTMNLINISGTWISGGRGGMSLSQNGNVISGSAYGINPGDHFGEGHRNGGSISGYIADNGTIVLYAFWGDGTLTDSFMNLSQDGRTISGTWNWYTDSSRTTLKGTGTYSIERR